MKWRVCNFHVEELSTTFPPSRIRGIEKCWSKHSLTLTRRSLVWPGTANNSKGFPALPLSFVFPFYRAELGQEASNARPLPQTPIPAAEKGMLGEQKPEKVSLSLD